MCWVCKKWKKSSPKTFARWSAAGRGEQLTALDASLYQAARGAADDAVAELGIEKMRDAFARGHTLCIEGELTSDHVDLSREDYTLFNWMVRHAIAEAIEGRPH
jgi:hypothetical protein